MNTVRRGILTLPLLLSTPAIAQTREASDFVLRPFQTRTLSGPFLGLQPPPPSLRRLAERIIREWKTEEGDDLANALMNFTRVTGWRPKEWSGSYTLAENLRADQLIPREVNIDFHSRGRGDEEEYPAIGWSEMNGRISYSTLETRFFEISWKAAALIAISTDLTARIRHRNAGWQLIPSSWSWVNLGNGLTLERRLVRSDIELIGPVHLTTLPAGNSEMDVISILARANASRGRSGLLAFGELPLQFHRRRENNGLWVPYSSLARRLMELPL